VDSILFAPFRAETDRTRTKHFRHLDEGARGHRATETQR
jgi:hypothetical protein